MVTFEDVNDDDDDDDDNDIDDDVIGVQLGFSIDIISQEQYEVVGHRVNTNTTEEWDGGQLGGWPSWLNPINVPKRMLHCTVCQTPMNFLCQLYAPIDTIQQPSHNDINTTSTTTTTTTTINYGPPDRAFHRTLYVFICPNFNKKKIVVKQQQHQNDLFLTHTAETSVRVLRTQLSEFNNYWSLSTTDSATSTKEHQQKQQQQHQQQQQNFCRVCNFPATGKCPLQNEYFCSKIHQLTYKKYVYNALTTKTTLSDSTSTDMTISSLSIVNKKQQQHQEQDGSLSEPDSIYRNEKIIADLLPNVYPLSEIVVEEEPEPITATTTTTTQTLSNVSQTNNVQTLFPSKYSKSTNVDDDNDNDNGDDEYDSDENLDQDDLNDIVQGGGSSSTGTVDTQNIDQKKKMKKKKIDPLYERFIDRVVTSRRNVQNQIIRYNRWPMKQSNNQLDDDDDYNPTTTNDNDDDDAAFGPLWIQSDNRPTTVQKIPTTTNTTISTDQKDDYSNNHLLQKSKQVSSSVIPPCPNCGCPRKFEFQIMPQMIHYLHKQQQQQVMKTEKDNDETTTATTVTGKNVITKEMINAMEQAEEYIRSAPSELIPPALIDAKDNAITNIHKKLFDNSNNVDVLNWGTIAVYTCTGSCNPIASPTTTTRSSGTCEKIDTDKSTFNTKNNCNDNNIEEDLGAYLEEYAWLQRSID